MSHGIKGFTCMLNCPEVSLLWEFKKEWLLWINLSLHMFLFWGREQNISCVSRLQVGQKQVLF